MKKLGKKGTIFELQECKMNKEACLKFTYLREFEKRVQPDPMA